jgi:hypothetical protein
VVGGIVGVVLALMIAAAGRRPAQA